MRYINLHFTYLLTYYRWALTCERKYENMYGCVKSNPLVFQRMFNVHSGMLHGSQLVTSIHGVSAFV